MEKALEPTLFSFSCIERDNTCSQSGSSTREGGKREIAGLYGLSNDSVICVTLKT
jgi:hypothetical protein